MTPVTNHFQEVVAGVVETHRAARDSITPEYNRGVREGRNVFLTQLGDRVDELEGDGDLSIVRRWVMELRKEEAKIEPGDKIQEDKGVEVKEDKPERKKVAGKVEARGSGQGNRGALAESTRYHNLRKRHREDSEDRDGLERCRKRICE